MSKTSKNTSVLKNYKLSLKQKIDLEAREIILGNQNVTVNDDKRYTALLMSIVSNNISDIKYNSIEKCIDVLKNNELWLVETCTKINKVVVQPFPITVMGFNELNKFIATCQKCIISDLNNFKQIMEINDYKFTAENLNTFGSLLNVPIFEAPQNHMIRIWLLRAIKLLLEKFSYLSIGFMNQTKNFDENVFLVIHNILHPNIAYNEKISQRYNIYFIQCNQYKQSTIKLMNYLRQSHTTIQDLDDPDFYIDDFENYQGSYKILDKLNPCIKQESSDEEIQVVYNNCNKESSEPVKDKSLINENGPKLNNKTNDDTGNSRKRKMNDFRDYQELNLDHQLNGNTFKTDSSCQTESACFSLQTSNLSDAAVQTEMEKTLNAESNSTKKISSIPFSSSKFYMNGKFTDTLLLSKDKKFKVHKCILAAYSEVFSEMFDKNTKIINISKRSSTTVQAMLQFMYTNEVDDLDNIAMDLIKLASKYDIKELIDLCKKSLISNLTIDNALDNLIAADKANLKKLKKKIMKFIILNTQEIVVTDGFKNMQINYPDLVAELFCYKVKSIKSDI